MVRREAAAVTRLVARSSEQTSVVVVSALIPAMYRTVEQLYVATVQAQFEVLRIQRTHIPLF